MRRYIIPAAIAAFSLFSGPALQAQEAYKDAQNRFIIDCTAMSYLTVKTPQDVADSMVGGYMREHNVLHWVNRKVSPKFEIAAEDEGIYNTASGTTWYNHIWSVTLDKCHNRVPAGEWRPPTQRELMLVWILQGTLIKQYGYPPFSPEGYWTATKGRWDSGETEVSTNVYMNREGYRSGLSTSAIWAQEYRVRCVRDVAP